MVEFIGIALFVMILLAVWPKRDGFKEIERRQAMRESISKQQEKSQRYSL